jgi:hypothetical protein
MATRARSCEHRADEDRDLLVSGQMPLRARRGYAELDRSWIKRGEARYGLRDLTDDPGIDHVIGCVFHSMGDRLGPHVHDSSGTHAIPEIRGSWLFYNVVSADRFLDDYVADWQKVEVDDAPWHRGGLRTIDGEGVIAGPVDRIVFVDMDEHSVEALALRFEDP